MGRRFRLPRCLIAFLMISCAVYSADWNEPQVGAKEEIVLKRANWISCNVKEEIVVKEVLEISRNEEFLPLANCTSGGIFRNAEKPKLTAKEYIPAVLVPASKDFQERTRNLWNVPSTRMNTLNTLKQEILKWFLNWLLKGERNWATQNCDPQPKFTATEGTPLRDSKTSPEASCEHNGICHTLLIGRRYTWAAGYIKNDSIVGSDDGPPNFDVEMKYRRCKKETTYF